MESEYQSESLNKTNINAVGRNETAIFGSAMNTSKILIKNESFRVNIPFNSSFHLIVTSKPNKPNDQESV